MLVNFSLPPEIRTRIENLIPIGVIPGPHTPKSLDSFFIPLLDELSELAKGVRTYDALSAQSFELHAYLILFSGDMPAISKLLCLKGHNGYCPCRFCLIQGQRPQGSTTYYPVLMPPTQRDVTWNPYDLPPRTRANLNEHLTEMYQATTITHRNDLSTHYGVNRLSIFLRNPSFQFPDSFPYDIMHLFFENVCPLLCDQWTGSRKFKNIEPADPGYRLAPHIWEQIGEETARAYKTIPSEFVGAMPDITNSKYKAEYWSFWIQYLGPILLRNRFPNAKYYRHFCALVSIIKTCLQFTITEQEIDTLKESIVKWVEEYERCALIVFQSTLVS